MVVTVKFWEIFTVRGGRKFQAFTLLYLGTTLGLVTRLISEESFVTLYIYLGGFYVGANVVKSAIEMAISKWGSRG